MGVVSSINDHPIYELAIPILILVCVATELGYRYGRAGHVERSLPTAMIYGIKASIIGMVALLLGFSFSITSNRYHDRARLMLDEANSISTCYERTDLIAEPARSRIRNGLREYTDARVLHYGRVISIADYDRTDLAMNHGMAELWAGVTDAFRANPWQAHISGILDASNNVFDLAATRNWASRYTLPTPVVILLTLCMLISGPLVGHSSAEVGHRHLGLWFALNVLIVLVVFMILDFDNPRRGLIQADKTPLLRVQATLHAAGPAGR
jgi:hypothetical protein